MRIYLAGPDVFRADVRAHAEALMALCAQHGFVGVFPGDEAAGPLSALAIFDANIALIQSCDAVLANLTPFRGHSADVGTAWELGYGFAAGKAVHAYTAARLDYAARVRAKTPEAREDARGWADAQGDLIEDFGLADNLMLTECVKRAGGVFEIAAFEGESELAIAARALDKIAVLRA